MRKPKSIVLFLMITILISSNALATSAAIPATPTAPTRTYEGSGCATAEEALQLYLEGIQNGDLAKMLSAFAIETYVHNFDLSAQLQRTGAQSPSMSVGYPNANELFTAINVESRKQEIVLSIKFQLITFLVPDHDVLMITAFQGENKDAEIAAYVNHLEESMQSFALQNLQLTGFISPSVLSEIYNDERNQANLARQAKIYGADELRSAVASFIVDEKQYYLCCDALRYGDKWYLLTFNSNVGNILGLSISIGGIMPVE